MSQHLVVSILVCLTTLSAAARAKPAVRVLTDQAHIQEVGCGFHRVGSPSDDGFGGYSVFQWDFADEAWINIAGRDIPLHVISTREQRVRKNKSSVGDRRRLRLAAKGVTVSIETRATSACADNNESCEAWEEVGSIKVSTGRGSVVANIKGAVEFSLPRRGDATTCQSCSDAPNLVPPNSPLQPTSGAGAPGRSGTIVNAARG
jgi:hypothetical protein